MASGQVTATALNLRAAANGAVTGVLRQGCRVEILGQQGNWLNVSATQDGAALQGWVSASFVAQDQPGPPPAVSERAMQMIVRFEVTDEATYDRICARPTWPQGDSGVTIGIGYDLGYVTGQQFRGDWAGALGAAALDELARACGAKGAAAQALLGGLQAVTVPWTAANQVFRARSVPQMVASVVRALPRAAQLPADCLGALVSLAYNRGVSFGAAGDRYREMRAIRDDVAQGRLADVPDQIRSMRRLWIGKPGMEGLLARREDEADLFQAGLGA